MSQPSPSRIDPAKARRLTRLLDSIARVANSIRPFARNMTLIALAGGAGLVVELRHALDLATWSTSTLAVILLIPALLLAWLWWLLADLSDLPEQARHVFGTLHDVAVGAEPPAPGGVRGLFRLGGSLKEALSLAVDAGSLAGAIASVMLLANPIFLLLLGASLIAAVVLALAAAVGGLFFL